MGFSVLTVSLQLYSFNRLLLQPHTNKCACAHTHTFICSHGRVFVNDLTCFFVCLFLAFKTFRKCLDVNIKMFDTQDGGGRSRAHTFLAVKGNQLTIMKIKSQFSRRTNMMTFSDNRKYLYTSYLTGARSLFSLVLEVTNMMCLFFKA